MGTEEAAEFMASLEFTSEARTLSGAETIEDDKDDEEEEEDSDDEGEQNTLCLSTDKKRIKWNKQGSTERKDVV